MPFSKSSTEENWGLNSDYSFLGKKEKWSSLFLKVEGSKGRRFYLGAATATWWKMLAEQLKRLFTFKSALHPFGPSSAVVFMGRSSWDAGWAAGGVLEWRRGQLSHREVEVVIGRVLSRG